MTTALTPPARSTGRRWARRAFYAGLAASAVLLLWWVVMYHGTEWAGWEDDPTIELRRTAFRIGFPVSAVAVRLWPAVGEFAHWPWIVTLGPALNWALLGGVAGVLRDHFGRRDAMDVGRLWSLVRRSRSPVPGRPIQRYIRYWLAWVPGLYAAFIPAVYAIAAARVGSVSYVAVFTIQLCLAVAVLLLLGRAAAEADPRLLSAANRTVGAGLLLALVIAVVWFGQLGRVAEYAYVVLFQWLVLFTAIPAQLLVGALLLSLSNLAAPNRPPPQLRSSLALVGVVAVAFLTFLFLVAKRLSR